MASNPPTLIASPPRWRLYLACFLMLFPCLPLQASTENQTKVALVMKALSNPFFSEMERGARDFAREHGISLEVFGVERETDVERQISIVENLILRGYGALVIAPADSRKLVPVCARAMQKGVVVINVDNPLNKDDLKEHKISIPFIGPDNRAGAALVGDYIKRKLGGKGRVIVIEGIRGVENADLRKAGFVEALTKGSQIQIVASESANWHTDEAFSLTEKLLRTKTPVHAFLCANDKMALGVLRALDLLDLSGKILIGAYDNIDSVRLEMQSGRIHATAEQHPELMGALGVELASRALSGETIPQQISVPVDLITHEAFGKALGLCVSDQRNPFFATLVQGAQKAADLFGVQLIVKDAGNSDAQQLTDIMSLLERESAGIIINPTNTEMVAAGIELANEKGIPVITVDRKAADGQVLCHIESDNKEGGRKAARIVAASLDGGGKVIEMEGRPETSAALERGIGFNNALREYPQIKVVAREIAYFERDVARNIMNRIVRDGLEFDAVFAHNDNMILGVIEALESSENPEKKILVGFDGIKEALVEIERGRLTATVAQKPDLMGFLAVQSAVRHLRGETLPRQIFVELLEIKR